ncbi:PREDICTED: uncharacterized protein LOC106108282 [Papilio polytes]|uniref:uncharacterized protein LOC106108282 n=1 Tax=Papilio polytes TaxID=76194 RepID=UPI000675D4EF|nr:PREDICTED: uncharacterized protein LOC106108282 [Papilio polytes]
MICDRCTHSVKKDEVVVCSLCKKGFHYQCVDLTASFYIKNARDLKRSWKCALCVNITKRKGDKATSIAWVPSASPPPATPPSDDVRMVERHLQQPQNSSLSSSDTSPPGNAVTLQQISSLLDVKFESMKSTLMDSFTSLIKKQIEDLKDDFTRTTDFLALQQTDFNVKLEASNNTIQELQKQKNNLQTELTDAQRRLDALEKSSRSLNVEIQLVPDNRNENILSTVKQIISVIQAPVDEANIRCVRRVAKLNPQSTRPRNILVTLSTERQRDTFISAFKRYNKNNRSDPLNTTNLGIPGNKQAIYIMEHLPPYLKSLHAETRKTAKDKNYKYVWIKYGNIYIRKDDTSPAILVKNSTSLSKLM